MLTLRSFAALALVSAAGLAVAAEAKKEGSVKPVATQQTAPAEQGRDWTKIDTNRDNHVSPEEMEKWLAANPGPLKK